MIVLSIQWLYSPSECSSRSLFEPFSQKVKII
jgi:hypothetical protein